MVVGSPMTAPNSYVPYDQHAQCLLSFLETDDLRTSPSARALAHELTASFVRLDQPDDPERFQRIANRIVDHIIRCQEKAAEAPADELVQHAIVKSGIAQIMTEELGLPELPYYE